MRALLISMVVALCACSSTSEPMVSTSTPASSSRVTYPGASPSMGHYAVIQSGTGQIELVDVVRVGLVASVNFQPVPFRPNAQMPFTSASSARLYYLSAGSDLGYLTADGHNAIFRSIPLDANQEAGFAVSPDDQRVAVSLFSYSSTDADATYTGMRMYVEDLADGGHHVEIFTSTTVAEFPIGWVGGDLVVAVSSAFCCADPLVNPYGADSYVVVDPTTGRELRSLCSASAPPQGPVEPAGVMCGLRAFVHWDGTQFPQPAAVPDPGPNRVALSPDGTAVLYGGSPIQVIRGIDEFALDESGVALGWVDALHVIVATPDNNYWMLEARTGIGAEVPGATGYLGALPSAIS